MELCSRQTAIPLSTYLASNESRISVYEALARGSPTITPVHCWAQVRRQFIEAESSFPEECRRAIDLIGDLYAVERPVPALFRAALDEARAEAPALRGRLGQNRSRSIIAALRD
jgi:hypothetical protein